MDERNTCFLRICPLFQDKLLYPLFPDKIMQPVGTYQKKRIVQIEFIKIRDHINIGIAQCLGQDHRQRMLPYIFRFHFTPISKLVHIGMIFGGFHVICCDTMGTAIAHIHKRAAERIINHCRDERCRHPLLFGKFFGMGKDLVASVIYGPAQGFFQVTVAEFHCIFQAFYSKSTRHLSRCMATKTVSNGENIIVTNTICTERVLVDITVIFF